MKFLRSTLFVSATAILAAACGEKVQVLQPGTTSATAKVTSVAVSPANATMNIGDKITLTAAVNADAGVATSVTWASLDPTKASVDASGTVTALVATAGVAVCATSTVDAGKKACASIVVTAVATGTTVVQASVSIASITATGCTSCTVNPASVTGTIDVTLNVDPGNQTITNVVLLFGTVHADSQMLTPTQAAVLRSARDRAPTGGAAFTQIIFSQNTAAFDTVTGIPKWPNGPVLVGAQVYTKAGGTTTPAATAANKWNLTFRNVDGFFVSTTSTSTPPANSKVDASGYRWTGNGNLVIKATPVMFSGLKVGTVIAGLGSTTLACTAPTGPATSPFTVTLAYAGYQTPAACTGNTPQVPIISATDSSGNVLTLVPGGVINSPQLPIATGGQYPNAALGFRWDNVPPPTAGLLANPNGRAQGWINDAVVFNAVNTGTAATANNWVAGAVVDAGIGGAITYSVRVDTTYALAKVAAPLTSASTLPMTATDVNYCAVVYAADLLGNTTTSPAGTCLAPAISTTYPALPVAGAAALPFGVDRLAPTIKFDASDIGGAAQATHVRVNANAIGGNFAVYVADTGSVGNSGMLGQPVKASVTRRDASNTAACVYGGTSCAPMFGADVPHGVTTAIAAGVVTTGVALIAGPGTDGYYTYTVTAYDAAGNVSPTLTETIVKDFSAIVVTTPSVPATVTGGFTASANGSDNLDIRDFYYSVGYTTALILPATLRQPPVVVNDWNKTPLLNTNIALSQALAPYVVLQAPAAAYVAAANLLTGVNIFGRDQASLYTAPVLQAVVASTAPATGFAISSAAPVWTFSSWAAALSVATVCDGTVPANCVASGTGVASTTITASATGTSGTFPQPFTKVDFYISNGTDLVFIGTATQPAPVVDNGTTRVWSWTFSLTPGTTYGSPAARNVYAFGVNSTGLVAMPTAAVVLSIAP